MERSSARLRGLRLSIRIAEEREAKYEEQAGRCKVCNRPVRFALFQLAHLIPQRDWCYQHYGADVIDDPANHVGVCSLACNAAAQLDPISQQAEALAASLGWKHLPE